MAYLLLAEPVLNQAAVH